MDMHTVHAAISNRYSCRAYQDRPVERDTIHQILQLAQHAPSWCNVQPWEVVIVSGQAAKQFGEAYRQHASEVPPAPDFAWPPHYQDEHQLRRRECGLSLYQTLGIAKGDKAATGHQMLENYRFFSAPHVALITTPRYLGVYGAIDCGIYVANFVMAAQSLGVATIIQAALASHPAFVRNHFNLPDSQAVVCGIAFGYEDAGAKINTFRTTRETIDKVVRFID